MKVFLLLEKSWTNYCGVLRDPSVNNNAALRTCCLKYWFSLILLLFCFFHSSLTRVYQPEVARRLLRELQSGILVWTTMSQLIRELLQTFRNWFGSSLVIQGFLHPQLLTTIFRVGSLLQQCSTGWATGNGHELFLEYKRPDANLPLNCCIFVWW